MIRTLLRWILLCCAFSTPAFAESAFGSFGSTGPLGSFGAQSGPQGQSRFLPVDEAFRFSSSIEPGVLKLHWQVADDYYLYRDRIQIKVEQAGVVLEELRFSIPGEAKEDPYFGLVQVFTEDLTAELPILSTGGHDELTVRVSYQGCAEAGLCYPPQVKQALYLAGDVTGTTSTTDASAPASTTGSEPVEAAGDAVQPVAATDETASGQPVATAKAIAGGQATATAPSPAPNRVNQQQIQVDTDSAQSLAGFIRGASLWQILGLFFLLGIGLAFTPCVFPMVPILSTIIAGQRQATTRSSFILSLAYVLGVAALYSALGFAVGFLGAGTNLQAYLQEPWLLALFAAIFVLLALSMFGVYEIQLPSFLRDRLTSAQQSQKGGTLFGVFLMGILSALVVSPCVSAPLAGALLYIATTGDAGFGAMVLFALALGMGVPLLAIGTGAGKLLPKAGAWMVAVKAVFGILLIAVAIWLLERFMAGPATLAMWSLLAGVCAVYLGAFEPALTLWRKFWKGLGLMLFVYAVILLIGASGGASNTLRPLSHFTMQAENPMQPAPLNFASVYDIAQLEEQVQIAKSAGKPAMVDFYADWCISCKIMERDTFPHPDVRSQMSGMHLIKADVTANSAANQALLAKFGLFGPPGIIFYDREGQELVDHRIYGEISTDGFVRHLRQLPL